MDNFKRRVCCCEIFVKEAALRRATKLIILSDIFMLALWAFLYVVLIIYAIKPSSVPAGITLQNGTFIQSQALRFSNILFLRFAIVLSPLVIALFFKAYRGYYWMRRDNGRNSFLRYFNISWVYFLAQDVEFSLICLTSTSTLTGTSYLYIVLLIALSLPLLFILYLQNKHLEEQHFKLIDLRHDTL